MKAFVIDVNVAVVANGRDTHADYDCILACINAIEEVYQKGIVVIDDCMLILSEYMNRLKMEGQPGVGDAFMKWVWENQAVGERCERVKLTIRGDDPEDFLEFPNDPELDGFDRSDRKYVAVAIASRKNPVILNAVDTDWWHYKEAFMRNKIRIQFLCPQHMQ
jgi:hypothetical protein